MKSLGVKPLVVISPHGRIVGTKDSESVLGHLESDRGPSVSHPFALLRERRGFFLASPMPGAPGQWVIHC